MACTSLSMAAAAAASPGPAKEIVGMRRSDSGIDLGDKIRRSRSEPQLRCSLFVPRAATTKMKNSKSSTSMFSFTLPLPKFFDSDDSASSGGEISLTDDDDDSDENNSGNLGAEEIGMAKRDKCWIQRVLELRSIWGAKQQQKEKEDGDNNNCCDVHCESEEEEVAEVKDIEWDPARFRRFLTKVRWLDTKLFSKLAFLCNMAYVIPEIKEKDLIEHYGLRLVTSSLEKKLMAAQAESDTRPDRHLTGSGSDPEAELKPPILPHVAYEIAASAASYVHSRAKGLLSLCGGGESEPRELETVCADPEEARGDRVYNSEAAAFVAAKTMTAVVAAEEASRTEAAEDLRSLHSSPCEWYVCDDPNNCTRCFVIQGSDSLASWQANLMFDPTKFEGTQVLVHRGIYEAAKGIYDQFMPEIKAHLRRYGDKAKFRFTGHSLGGSLSLLVSLMLRARDAVPLSSLLPVVTFGSPSVFCGGRHVVDELGLDEGHIHSVMMHRDIVPRAFSCNYPNHVAQLLARLNGAFRFHPCLNNEKVLYSPIGKIFILQPDENSSPPHPLLPKGAALYALNAKDNAGAPIAGYHSALKAFLNKPHPLETLSRPTAYGSEGTILRDHESSNYLKAINGLIREQTTSFCRSSRKQKMKHLMPLSSNRHSEPSIEKPGRGLLPKEVVSTGA